MSDDTRLYINCMEEVRDRINLVTTIGAHKVTTGSDVFDIELVFMQLRKVLELIAFASLTANRTKYSAAHAKFAEHWKAKLMLKELEKINPEFYPAPIGQPQLQANGVKHIPAVTEVFLTKDDFESLYDKCSDILHVRNPFSAKERVVQIDHSVQEWVSRIQVLLGLHMVRLVAGKLWIVQVPGEGPIHLWPAEPLG